MDRRRELALVALLLTSIIIACGQPLPEPPVAKIEARVDTIFGTIMTDNYQWIRDRDNPEVTSYLEAENAYTAAVMKHTESLQEKLFQEMKGRIKEDDSSVPVRDGDYYYYSRTETGKQYSIHCRKKASSGAAEEILLDLNQLAEGKDYLYLGSYEISPNGNLMAYTLDEKGSERYTLRIRDLTTGINFDEVIENAATSLAWADDNRTLFYLTRDDTWRTNRLYRHTLGTGAGADVLVYEEPDDSFWMGVSRSKSDRFIYLGIGSKVTSEYRFIESSRPLSDFRIISPRRQNVEYEVVDQGERFYILTNDGAVNFRLMTASLTNYKLKDWQTLVPGSDSVKIDGMEVFRDHLALFIRVQGQTKVRVLDLGNGAEHDILFDEPVYTVEKGTNLEFNTDTLRLAYTSMLTPASTYDYAMTSREKILKKQRDVLGGYDPSQYQQERQFVKASDDVMIPLTIVYRKGMAKNGSNPCYLYGYGAYGISTDPYFSSNRVSLLDRGFVFAIAHVRGGGEMGRPWYENGKYLQKKNTFTDFIACADFLISNNYTNPEKLVAAGGSAGGLLVGAVVNMRPELFKVAVADVPFVDIINTMRDESIPLTVIEYEEWGNPHDSIYFEYMRSYSPYDNVVAIDYPNMLITGGLNDPRVAFWEPVKWTAKLRATKTDKNRLLLKINMGAGHGGASGRFEALRELALEYAFILDVLGIKE